MLAWRNLDLPNIDALYGDIWREPLNDIDSGLFKISHTRELGSIAAPPNARNCNFKFKGECI